MKVDSKSTDTRLWYCFELSWSSDDPDGRKARGLCHRLVKGNWTWTSLNCVMLIFVENSQDAMMVRLYMGDHYFKLPNYKDGFIDFTTRPFSIFWNGAFRAATADELEMADLADRRDLMEEVDECDDWVQYCHETKS